MSASSRMTKQKQALLQVLSDKPQSAAQIVVALHQTGVTMDPSTVYRNLKQMEAAGTIRATSFDRKVALYELAHSSHHHHHLVCEDCGKVEDVELDEQLLLTQVAQQSQFTITNHHLEFFGHCPTCKYKSS